MTTCERSSRRGEAADRLTVRGHRGGYLVATRLGSRAELDVLGELGGAACELARLGADDLHAIRGVIECYEDQGIGVADASLVVLAAKHQTRSLLTLDHRHFGVVRSLRGGRFTFLP